MIPFPKRQSTLSVPVIPREELIEKLRSEFSLVVKCQRTATMLVHVNVVDPHAEQRIRYEEEPRDRAPRLDQMQKRCEEQRQTNAPSKVSTRAPCVNGPDDTVIVPIEEHAVLFQNLFDTEISMTAPSCNPSIGMLLLTVFFLCR